MQKWCKLRSGQLFGYTRTLPQGAVQVNADGTPFVDEPVQPVDGGTQADPVALVDQEPAKTQQVGDLPDGPAFAIIEWVGDDPQRAVQAVAAENERARPRPSVIKAVSPHLPEPTEGA